MAKKQSKNGGLSRVREMFSKTARDGAHPFAVLLGLWGGSLAGRLIDKGVARIPDKGDGEKFQWKKLIKPIVLTGTGIAITYYGIARDKDGEEEGIQFIKHLGYGVVGSGLVSGVRVFIKKDLFEGLGETDNNLQEKYYTEAKEEIMKVLNDASFKPALPEPALPAMTISSVNSPHDMGRLQMTEDADGVII